jgi:Uma2 family endonuclease
MTIALREPWTIDRFLAWEDKQEGRHEFDGSRIVGVTGGSRAHQRIISNLIRLLEDALDPDLFDAVPEMRLQVAGKIRYPDVAVVAGRIPDDVRTLQDAIVLFEVLSDDTAATDRREKRAEYARLPGLRRYVLLEQGRMAATVLRLGERGWVETELAQRDAGAPSAGGGTLELPEIGVALFLDAIYRGVRLNPGASDSG